MTAPTLRRPLSRDDAVAEFVTEAHYRHGVAVQAIVEHADEHHHPNGHEATAATLLATQADLTRLEDHVARLEARASAYFADDTPGRFA